MEIKFTHSKIKNDRIILILIFLNSIVLNGQTTHQVNVSSNKFTPADIIIMAGDIVTWTNTDGTHNVDGMISTFPSNPESFGNNVGGPGWTYSHEFNIPGKYDYQCDPHVQYGMVGTITVIENADSIFVNLTGMTPHIGEEAYFELIDEASGMIIDRISETVQENFTVELGDIVPGGSYRLDFFSDHNGNGLYDAPPVDHAWRIEISNATAGEVIDFAHNTNFTDIDWKYRLEVMFSGMTPHIGEMLTMYVRDESTGSYLDTIVINEIEAAEFTLKSYVIQPGMSYLLDIFADHNGNGIYDPPGTDHAWRVEVPDIIGDTEFEFIHNTNFTDIFAQTGITNHALTGNFKIYPNPVISVATLFIEGLHDGPLNISVIDLAGNELMHQRIQSDEKGEAQINLEGFEKGLYLMNIRTRNSSETLKFVKD